MMKERNNFFAFCLMTGLFSSGIFASNAAFHNIIQNQAEFVLSQDLKNDLEPIKQKSNVTIFKKVINSRESCKDKAEYRKSLVNLLNDSLVLLLNHETYNGKNFGEIFDEFAKSDITKITSILNYIFGNDNGYDKISRKRKSYNHNSYVVKTNRKHLFDLDPTIDFPNDPDNGHVTMHIPCDDYSLIVDFTKDKDNDHWEIEQILDVSGSIY